MNMAVQAPTSEIELDSRSFEAISQKIYEEAGIVLSEGKRSMVQSRLRKRVEILGLTDFKSYVELVSSSAGQSELPEMISSLTTNVSHFFREEHHFDIMGKQALPELISRAEGGGRIRIWSAACSNGQEPYSVSMSLLENFPSAARYDVKILATDIDRQVVKSAKMGIYPEKMQNGLSPNRLDSFGNKNPENGEWQVKQEVQRLITFKQLNLLGPWPMKGKFDIIFCRNVVIYFDSETQDTLWQRLISILNPGGWLFVGHSERLSGEAAEFAEPAGLTAYRKHAA